MKFTTMLFLVAAALLAMIALVGCSDGILPSGEPPANQGISGRVTDSEGAGIPGITVRTTDGTTFWTDTTDENGNYSLPDVTPGSRVVAFAGTFWTTKYQPVVVGDTGITADVTLDPSETSAVPPPGILLDEPDVNQTSGVATISGSITNLDVENAVFIVNGSATLITTSDGDFSTVAILHPGANTIYVWAVNSGGSTISEPIEITWTPTGNVYFRTTLTWDGPGDIDLHTWDPNMNHCAYWNKTISTGILDVDNIVADGPENFTCIALVDGRFRIAVNSFDSAPRNATIRVSVFSGPNAGKTYTFGPYLFTVSNEEEGYPITGNTASWWRPCDVLVSGSNISVVAPDGTALPQNLTTMTRGKKK